MKAHSLSELAAIHRALREQRQRAEEAAARRAAIEAARQRERELFARTVGEVTPLRHTNLASIDRPRPLPEPFQRALDEAEVLRVSLSDDFDAASLMETDDQLSYRQSGIGDDVLKHLRLGRWSLQGQIDLHGHTRDQAREALADYLRECHRRGMRCLRVVHGKGLGSPGKAPVLKNKVHSWLVQKNEVLAFVQAKPADGGAGALVVLLTPGQPAK